MTVEVQVLAENKKNVWQHENHTPKGAKKNVLSYAYFRRDQTKIRRMQLSNSHTDNYSGLFWKDWSSPDW